jgi:hypothetical protein
MGRTILLGSFLVLCVACGGDGGGNLTDIEVRIEGDGTVVFVRRGEAQDPTIRQCPGVCTDSWIQDDGFDGWTLNAFPAEGSAFVRWETASDSVAECLGVDDATSPELWTLNGHYVCTAVFASCPGPDPQDLADDPLGDPTLDIRCVSTGSRQGGEPWVRVQMVDSWPPPEVYSWYTTVTLSDATTVIGSYTRELHDGVSSTITSGAVTETNSRLEENPGGIPGYQVVVPTALLDQIVTVAVETGILKTEGGEFRMDGAVTLPF